MGNEQKSIRRPACARRGGNPHVPSPTSPSSQVVESVACRLWSSLQEAVPSPVPVPRLLAYAAARIGSAGTRADTTPDYLVQPCAIRMASHFPPRAWIGNFLAPPALRPPQDCVLFFGAAAIPQAGPLRAVHGRLVIFPQIAVPRKGIQRARSRAQLNQSPCQASADFSGQPDPSSYI